MGSGTSGWNLRWNRRQRRTHCSSVPPVRRASWAGNFPGIPGPGPGHALLPRVGAIPAPPMSACPNLLLGLPFEGAIEDLGPDYWDVVEAAPFPQTRLRFRNDPLLRQLGLDPAGIDDADLEEAYGRFECRTPLLALRYHGYQFDSYNPQLGDGRGFLYGQLRDRHGQLQDLGTKGSGTTPWSRSGDGRLTLKGGVREVIASEALQRLGVTTSRTLSLIETCEGLWRGDEPSPTRSSVMVRLARTHLRFGTCERLLRHVVAIHYPHLQAIHGDGKQRLLAFYGELVQRVARLAAEWMAAGSPTGCSTPTTCRWPGRASTTAPSPSWKNGMRASPPPISTTAASTPTAASP